MKSSYTTSILEYRLRNSPTGTQGSIFDRLLHSRANFHSRYDAFDGKDNLLYRAKILKETATSPTICYKCLKKCAKKPIRAGAFVPLRENKVCLISFSVIDLYSKRK